YRIKFTVSYSTFLNNLRFNSTKAPLNWSNPSSRPGASARAKPVARPSSGCGAKTTMDSGRVGLSCTDADDGPISIAKTSVDLRQRRIRLFIFQCCHSTRYNLKGPERATDKGPSCTRYAANHS